MHLSDQEIIIRLTSFEDSLVERKVVSDVGDCLKTAVAFANTAPIGVPAIIFVGVRDDGEIEGAANLDKIQQSVTNRIAKAYPPIYSFPRVLAKDGKQFLAVIILGSESRPHFSGGAYLREGSKSVPASQLQFENLIAQRNSKAYEILKWRDKAVTFSQPTRDYISHGSTQWSPDKRAEVYLVDCNQHYVTFAARPTGENRVSFPLRVIELTFDHARNRLELELREGALPDSLAR